MKKKDKRALQIAVMTAALLCFACVAYSIANSQVLTVDTTVREWAYSLRNPLSNSILIGITYLGNWQTITALAVIFLVWKGTRKNIGLPFAVTAVLSTIIYKSAKMVFQRPRPDLSVRIVEAGGFSFPSGHSMNCLVCYGILIYLTRRYCKSKCMANWITAGLTLLIFLIGSSRVYLGVHFPSDIIGGWSLGLAVLMGAIIIIENRKEKKNEV